MTIMPVIDQLETGDHRHPTVELTQVVVPTGALDDILDALQDRRIFIQDEQRLLLLDEAILYVGSLVIRQALHPAPDARPMAPACKQPAPWLRHR